MSSENDRTDELEAVNQLLGGLPPGFDQQSPDYRRAFLKRRIPELQKEIADLEAQTATSQPGSSLRSQLQEQHAADLKQWAKRGFEASKKGVPFTTPKPVPPKGGGFFDFLGDLFGHVVSHTQLDAKRKILMDMEARYEALQGPAPQPKPSVMSPQRQRARILTDIAALEAERDKACAGIADERLRNVVKAVFDDKIQKELEKL